MKDSNQQTPFWIVLRDYVDYLEQTLPYAPEPEIVYFDHPDEEYKNTAQLEQIEEDRWGETDEFIARMCKTHNWPKKSKAAVRYCASLRLKWAKPLLQVFAIPDSQTGEFKLPTPKTGGFDLLRWLLTDGYAQRKPPPPKLPFTISGVDGKKTRIWT